MLKNLKFKLKNLASTCFSSFFFIFTTTMWTTCARELVLATRDLRSPISERPSIESPMLGIIMSLLLSCHTGVLLSTKLRKVTKVTNSVQRNLFPIFLSSWDSKSKAKVKKNSRTFWRLLSQWKWPTGRKAAKRYNAFQLPAPVCNMWCSCSWLDPLDKTGPETFWEILGPFLPVAMQNFHITKRLPVGTEQTLLFKTPVIPYDYLKKLEWGIHIMWSSSFCPSEIADWDKMHYKIINPLMMKKMARNAYLWLINTFMMIWAYILC